MFRCSIHPPILTVSLAATFATALAAALAAPIAAQVNFATSPNGMLTREGASLHAMASNSRYQAIDRTLVGAGSKSINAVAFRRDGRILARESGGNVTVTMKLGLGKPLAHLNGDPAKNWFLTPTTVFNQSTKFPNWNVLPTTPPAPFDFSIPFSSNYVYSAALPLAWEVTWRGYSTPNGRPLAQHFDSAVRASPVIDAGSPVGTGCGSFKTEPKFLTAGPAGKGIGMQVSVSGSGAPAGAPVLWSIDVKDSNLTVPGWCAKVHALPTVLIPLGKADAQGYTDVHGFAFPYDKSIENVSVFSQLVSSDPLGIVLAQAMKNTIPASTTNNEAFETASVWHLLTATRADLVLYGGSIVARLKH